MADPVPPTEPAAAPAPAAATPAAAPAAPKPAAGAAPAAPAAAKPAAPAAPAPAAAATAVAEPAGPPKLKVRKHKQRSCDERDAKGKLCAGHLKRYYDYPKEIAAIVGGPQVEVYRCEFCKTLYKPDPEQLSQSFTLRN
jgi:hypothetical protein